MGTRLVDEQPDTEVIGRVDTGHHWFAAYPNEHRDVFLTILSLTLRLVSVADQLPDQDELRQAQQIGPNAAVESARRPIVWDGEEMGIDEECEISFETLSDKAANASQRRPLGRLDSTGQVVEVQDGHREKTELMKRPPMRKQTVQYGLPAEHFDWDETEVLTDTDRLAEAAVGSSYYVWYDQAEPCEFFRKTRLSSRRRLCSKRAKSIQCRKSVFPSRLLRLH